MLGIVRFTLAMGVVVYHLHPQFAHFSGPAAVFGFYTVSGYLVAKILCGVYRGRLGAFLLNRALRIYPAYWVVCIMGLLMAYSGMPVLNPAIAVPGDIGGWIRQVTVFGILSPSSNMPYLVRLVPPSWSLNMELVWYLAMIPLVRVPLPWFVLSCGIALVLSVSGSFELAYYSFTGPAFCFSLGALVSVLGIRTRSSIHRWTARAFLVACLAAGNSVGPQVWLLYLASMATAYIICSSDIALGGRWKIADRWSGMLSYPVFLCHWHVASMVQLPQGWMLLMISLPFILIVSWMIVRFVEMPLAGIRNRVRSEEFSSMNDCNRMGIGHL